MKQAVKDIIELFINGMHITSKGIASYMNKRIGHDTVPAVRNIIRELINEGCPIGSDRHGYFLITNRDELEDTLEGLQSRCDAIQARIVGITNAYTTIVNSRHLNTDYCMKDRCRFYVIYIAETSSIPYQAVWTMAYRKLQKGTGVDLVNLPSWYQGSVLNYVENQGLTSDLYFELSKLEGVLI